MHSWLRARVSFTGVLLASIALALSLTPSLVPRTAVLQGLVAGISVALAYGLGSWLGHVSTALPLLRSLRLGATSRRWLWISLGIGLILATPVLSWRSLVWQNDVRAHVDMPPLGGVDIGMFLLSTVVVAAVLFGIGNLIGRLNRLLNKRLARKVGARVSKPLGVLATGAAVWLVAYGVLVFGVLGGINLIYAQRNADVDPAIAEPLSTYRSAGAESAVNWADLGSWGRTFIGGGPSKLEISAITELPARDPVRVYVGEAQGETLKERAAIAVNELKRTGAFERASLLVATPTGSGWLEPQTVDAFEYVGSGDTAIVSMQYAFTPSWVSFLFDQDLPVAASTALFDAVYAEWETLPTDSRPQLFSYGLSLGSHGAQSVFSSVDEVTTRTSGAVYVGTPNATPLWKSLNQTRDEESPLWQPVLDDGLTVRWLSQRGDFDALPGKWEQPRVAYLQHATDPVTWLSPTLLWQAPEWLGDQRAPDVSRYMRWMPGITGIQVFVDMLLGESVPAGHGHNYGDVIVDAWTSVTPNPALSDAAVERIQRILESYSRGDDWLT
ncbi:alpha/beta hydrolase [Lysinibacter cavernae]|uniref:Putative membrane protein n=1 Tax=Lysinibacter cavernae TaxID=1640652 RepID=A0A7X5R026_9MICO|nr:alpha/beta-hydrolase family protein [Lysinibacter cavernae]NIH53131.1 putative membrane protein [Lysinibacter cavernae]